MTVPTYMTDGVDADLVRLIKNGAVFLRETSTGDIPTSETWTPADPETVLGYYGESGVQITPNPGDMTEFVGHNGDILIAEQDPGYWTLTVGGLEGKKVPVHAYFDTEPGADGSVTVTKASASKRWDAVVVGLDQKSRLILAHFPNIQLESREAIDLNRTTMVILGMTFRTFLGRSAAPYHLKAWGLVPDEESSSSSSA